VLSAWIAEAQLRSVDDGSIRDDFDNHDDYDIVYTLEKYTLSVIT